MSQIARPLHRFIKGFLDLLWYMWLIVVVLWAVLIATMAALPTGVQPHGLAYLQSGLLLTIKVDANEVPIDAADLGIDENVAFVGTGKLVFFEADPPIALVGIAATLVRLGLILLILFHLRRVMQTICDGNPFVRRNRYDIRRIGFGMAAAWALLLGIDLVHAIIVRGAVTAPGITFSASPSTRLSLLLVGLVAIVLADAFSHGSDLQAESDLTV